MLKKINVDHFKVSRKLLKNVMMYEYNIGDSPVFKELNIGNSISLDVRVVYKCAQYLV